MNLNYEQQRIFDWLNIELGLPVFADAYKGASVLLNLKSEGYVSFVAHAGRDLMNGLAATVAKVKSERVQYQQHVDELQKHWQDSWRLEDDLSPELVTQDHHIPAKVCQMISDLIASHNSGRMRSADADSLFFSTFLDYSDRDKIPANFLSEWKNTKQWFLAHAHLREKPFIEKTERDIEKYFNCLDGYLYIAASSQYDRLREINEILDATNQ